MLPTTGTGSRGLPSGSHTLNDPICQAEVIHCLLSPKSKHIENNDYKYNFVNSHKT